MEKTKVVERRRCQHVGVEVQSVEMLQEEQAVANSGHSARRKGQDLPKLTGLFDRKILELNVHLEVVTAP